VHLRASARSFSDAIAYVFKGSSCRRVSAAILAPSHDGGSC
jgi:hypothetical protein